MPPFYYGLWTHCSGTKLEKKWMFAPSICTSVFWSNSESLKTIQWQTVIPVSLLQFHWLGFHVTKQARLWARSHGRTADNLALPEGSLTCAEISAQSAHSLSSLAVDGTRKQCLISNIFVVLGRESNSHPGAQLGNGLPTELPRSVLSLLLVLDKQLGSKVYAETEIPSFLLINKACRLGPCWRVTEMSFWQPHDS